jgi:hypothetical protein
MIARLRRLSGEGPTIDPSLEYERVCHPHLLANGAALAQRHHSIIEHILEREEERGGDGTLGHLGSNA